MWLYRVMLVILLAIHTLHLRLSWAQNPIEPFFDGFISALSSAYAPPNDTDVPMDFGRPIEISEVPFQIALYKNNYFICSGAIISSHWVLTSADCVHDGGNFGIRAGSSSNIEGGHIRHVAAVVINGGYNFITKENNVAMLRMEHPFVWTRYIRPTSIAGPHTKVPQNLLVTAWGYLDDHLSDSVYELRAVEVTSLSQTTCKYAYQETVSVTAGVLCASVPPRDACRSDAGSPMTHNGVLYGIQSVGGGCNRIDLPGIFTNVRRQLRWIKSVESQFADILSK